MAEKPQNIPLVGFGGLHEASPDEAEYLTGLGFDVAKPEDIEFYEPAQQAIGLVEAGGRALFGPLATATEIALGAEPERIKKREEISVGKELSTAIELGGLVLPGIAMTKAASLAAKGAQVPNYLSRLATASKFTMAGAGELAASSAAAGIEGQIARLATKYGIENAVFGAADEVDKILLSDEPQDALQNAQNVITGSGLSFLIGAGLGAGVGKVSELWKATKGGKTARVLEQIQKDADQVITEADTLAQSNIPPQAVPPTAQEFSNITKESIKTAEDLNNVVEGLPSLEALPLEKRKIVEEAAERLRQQGLLLIEPHKGMLRALEDTQAMNFLNAVKERGDKLAKNQIIYEQHVKKQSVDGINNTITSLSKNPVKDKLDAGQKFIDLVSTQYQKTKDGFESFFSRFDKAASNKLDDIATLGESLQQSIPSVMNALQVTENGIIKLVPYTADLGISRPTYQAVKDIVKALNKEEITIGQVRNLRKSIDDFLSKDISGQARLELSRLKSSLMDIIENQISKIDSSLEVRKNFAAYRQNELFRESLEKLLNGRFGAEGVLEKQIKPENVLKMLFSNTVSVNDAKRLLGDKWNEVLADYLAMVADAATDKTTGVFSSANFKNFLKNKESVLKVAFEGQEQKLQNLIDYTTLMRTISDRAPANPSRTAPTLLELGKQLLGIGNIFNPATAAEKVGDLALLKLNEKATKEGFEKLLQDKSAKTGIGMYRFLESAKGVSASGFEAMQQFLKESAKGAYLVKDSVKSIFNDDKKSPVKPPSERDLKSLDNKMLRMEQSLENVLDASGDIGYYLPEQDTALGIINTRVMQYLATQRPGIKQSGLLNEPRNPTKSDQQKYYRTLQIAEQPAIVLKRIKEGTLISSDVKDLKTMYPETYNYFLNNLTEEIIDKKSQNKPIPFRIRKSLSLFTGMPLDTTLQPQSIQAAQATYQPQQQPQPQGLPQMAKKSSRKSQLPNLTETDQQRRMLNR